MAKLMLDRYTIHAIAEEVVKVMEERKKPHMVTTEEAAKMLGLSVSRIRQIKDRLDYVKVGDDKQGHLLFNADTLIENYTEYRNSDK